MPPLALYLLGPPRVERDGEPVRIRRHKALALLTYLAVTGRGHTRDALATLFWPDLDQARARAGLRRELAVLKEALGPGWLDVDREEVGFCPETGVWLDVNEFEARLAESRTHGHPADDVCPACLAPLAKAAALYRDNFLAGFSLRDSPGFDDWQFFQSEGLRDELAGALERLVHVHAGRGELEPAIAYGRRWLALDPLHEPAQRQLMRLYAWSGQRAAALRQYHECERVLRKELGVPPEEETARLYRAIKAGREALPPMPLPASTAAAPKHNLPIQPTPFIGREKVLAEIQTFLDDPNYRLLTLVGPGGSGKTRLALEAAARQVDRFEGVYLVSLAALRSAEAIVPAVAKAVGFAFSEEGAPRAQLIDALRGRCLLLILDNLEHLLDGVDLVGQILETASDVQILCTSRIRLNIQGERVFPVAGLEFPDAHAQPPAEGPGQLPQDATRYSAVQLFLASARRGQPGFQLTPENLPDVVHICRLVQGMPLEIVLAAAWVPLLSPAEIAAEIERSFDFLEADLRDVPERHRSLRAVFDHSWKLLTEHEQDVFKRLAVFRGGFSLQAAQRVAGATLRDLRSLVEKSLLSRPGLYEMHELLRQYATEKLAADPDAGQAARDRHSGYYTAALQQWAEDLQGPRQPAVLAEMIVESDNIRAAWEWVVQQRQVDRLGPALTGLGRFYALQGRFQEGEAAFRMAAEGLGVAEPVGEGLGPGAAGEESMLVQRWHQWVCLRATILAWQAFFDKSLGRTESARRLIEESLALLDRAELAGQDVRAERAFALLQAGTIIRDLDWGIARQRFEQSLALYQEEGDRWGTATVLNALGWLHRYTGAYELAERCFQEGLAIWQSLGDRRGIADALWGLCGVALRQGQLEQAERLVRESSAIYQTLGDRVGNALRLCDLGETLVDLGKFAEGSVLLKKGQAIFADLGLLHGLADACSGLALANLHLGQYRQVHALGEQGLALYQSLGHRDNMARSYLILGSVALIEEAYVEAEWLLQQAEAIYGEIEPVSETAWVQAGRALAARGLGRSEQARRYLHAALRTAVDIRSSLALMWVLPIGALFLADQGARERAVEVYARASRYPGVADSRWFGDIAGARVAAATAGLPPASVAAAQARGRERNEEEAVAELLAELAG